MVRHRGAARSSRLSVVRALALTAAIATTVVSGAVGAADAAVHPPKKPKTFAAFANAALPPLPVGWPLVKLASKTKPVTVVPGVLRYTEDFKLPHSREHAVVETVDLSNLHLHLGVVAANSRVINPVDERPSSMATRTGAVAGINGDYFDIGADGAPWSGVMTNGTLMKTPTQNKQALLTVDSDGTAHIGPVTFTGTASIQSVTPRGRLVTVTKTLRSINTVSDAVKGSITEITPTMGADPMLPAGLTLLTGVPVSGGLLVQQVSTGLTSLPLIPEGEIGLLAGKGNGTWLTTLIPNQMVTLTSALSDPKAQQMLGGPAVIVQNGAVYDDPTGHSDNGDRNPETMVGVSQDGKSLMFVVIDGRQPGYSSGVSVAMAAQYLVAHGAWSGILLDGGGSSAIVASVPNPKTRTSAIQVLNRPSDSGGERPVGDGLFVYSD